MVIPTNMQTFCMGIIINHQHSAVSKGMMAGVSLSR